MKRDWGQCRISSGASLLDAMRKIAQSRMGIALVVDEEDRLLGTVVDGDIRRAVLRGEDLNNPARAAMNRSPITARTDQPFKTYLDLMVKHVIQQLPLVDQNNKVVDLVLSHDIESILATGPKAVIMAGGLGMRLRPLTEEMPKPLLPVGERPIMGHILNQLRESGIREVVVATHYKGEMIENHFGDGSSLGLDIRYVKEQQRYGTIGALQLMKDHLKEPFVVINGDVLTKLDFSAMAGFHFFHKADMTVGVRKYDFKVPYGVMKVEQGLVSGLEEKPTVSLFINAGIYLLNPDVIDCIDPDQPMDATDLIRVLIKQKRNVAAFPVLEYWMDVGQPTDYQQANTDMTVDPEKAPLWSKVLVTGAAGFIGSHLTERLASEGFDVRAFVRYNSRNDWGWLETLSPALSERIEVFRGDIKDSEAVHKAMEDVEVVYHLAALISIPYSYVNPLDIIQTNVVGTANVLNACRRSKALRKMVHTSTSEVYGTARSVPITEGHELQAQSPYSATKIGADKLCESYHRSFGLPVAIIRPFNTYGPRQSARAIIPSIVIQALHGKTVRIGSTAPVRDFCFVADTVSGFRAIADSPDSVGRVLNIGTGVGSTIGEMARKILDLMESKANLVVEQERIRPDNSEVMKLLCDFSEAQRHVHWHPKYSIDDGLAETIAWLKTNAGRYKPDFYNF